MSVVLELQVTAGTPVLRGFDHTWSVIRELGRDGRLFTVSAVDAATNDRHARSTKDFIGRLLRAGIVEAAEKRGDGPRAQVFYRLLRRPVDTPVLPRSGKPGRQGRGQVQMWNAIRILGAFNAEELAVSATTEECVVSVETARTYMRRLAAAGYLSEAAPAMARRRATWRLKRSMNSGPKPPMILRTHLVYDQNRRRIVGPVMAEETAP